MLWDVSRRVSLDPRLFRGFFSARCFFTDPSTRQLPLRDGESLSDETRQRERERERESDVFEYPFSQAHHRGSMEAPLAVAYVKLSSSKAEEERAELLAQLESAKTHLERILHPEGTDGKGMLASLSGIFVFENAELFFFNSLEFLRKYWSKTTRVSGPTRARASRARGEVPNTRSTKSRSRKLETTFSRPKFLERETTRESRIENRESMVCGVAGGLASRALPARPQDRQVLRRRTIRDTPTPQRPQVSLDETASARESAPNVHARLFLTFFQTSCVLLRAQIKEIGAHSVLDLIYVEDEDIKSLKMEETESAASPRVSPDRSSCVLFRYLFPRRRSTSAPLAARTGEIFRIACFKVRTIASKLSGEYYGVRAIPEAKPKAKAGGFFRF